jgi:hypothetical protein
MTKDPLIEELFKGKSTAYPKEVISGSGDAWYLNPETRSMERVYRGSVVKRVSTNTDSRGRHLVKFGTVFILIPEEELFSIGDN